MGSKEQQPDISSVIKSHQISYPLLSKTLPLDSLKHIRVVVFILEWLMFSLLQGKRNRENSWCQIKITQLSFDNGTVCRGKISPSLFWSASFTLILYGAIQICYLCFGWYRDCCKLVSSNCIMFSSCQIQILDVRT